MGGPTAVTEGDKKKNICMRLLTVRLDRTSTRAPDRRRSADVPRPEEEPAALAAPGKLVRRRLHSALMFAALTIGNHFSTSAL